MSKLTKKVGFLNVIESTPGQDPGSGYEGVLVNEGLDIKPVGEKITRNILTTTLSPQGHVIGAKNYQLSFEAELKGGGASGGNVLAPELDQCLRMCALKREDLLELSLGSVSGTFQLGEEITDTTASASLGALADVVVSGSSATLYIHNYTGATVAGGDTITGASSGASGTASDGGTRGLCYHPVSRDMDMETGCIHLYRDGIRHVLTYVMGTVDIDFKVGSYPIAKFDLQGVYTDPTDEADPSVNYSDITPPLVLSAGLQIADVDMSQTCATALAVGLKNTVSPRRCINAADGISGFRITGREPAGSVDPEVIALSAFNPWMQWKDAGTQKIYAQIGNDAGNRIRVSIPNALYDSIAYGDREGILTYDLPFICKGGNSGDDELWLFFT